MSSDAVSCVVDVPESLLLRAWRDELVERHGVDPRSDYVEQFWLPLLGPTSILLLRRLASELERSTTDACELALEPTARALGIGTRGGRNSPLVRTLTRCSQFRLLDLRREVGEVLARTRLPTLTRAQGARLPEPLREEHDAYLAHREGSRALAELRDRAQKMALTLLQMGEDPVAAERHLHHLRFHPAMARAAICWAVERHAAQAAAAVLSAPDA